MFKTIKSKILLSFISFSALFMAIFIVSQLVSFSYYRSSRISEIGRITHVNVEKINQSIKLMENCASSLAQYGAYYYETNRNGGLSFSNESAMKSFLVNTFTGFKIALGGGVWYEPDAIDRGKRLYGPYAFREKEKVVFTWDLSTEKYNYLKQDWYTFALPPEWSRSKKREKDFYWTAPYSDEAGSGSLMITVDAFMYDSSNRIIGISTVDWSLDQLLNFLTKIKITPNSETFLADRDSGKVISYTLDSRMVMHDLAGVPVLRQISSGKDNSSDHFSYRKAAVGKRSYHVFSILTVNNMIYGVMIPDNEFLTETVRNITVSLSLSVFLALVLVLFINYFITRQFAPLGRVAHLMKDLASGGGDLTRSIDIKTDDEIGELSRSFNIFTENLKVMISDIIQISSELSSSAGRVASDNTKISGEIANQSERLGDVSRNISMLNEKLSANTTDINSSERKIAELRSKSLEGNRIADSAAVSIEEINGSSRKISEIIQILDGIAFQTNLLALNASVEAARAGESGRGFAVVASEVRNLAQRSGEASREIKKLIEDTITKVDTGTKAVTDTVAVLKAINDESENISGMIYRINLTSNEQMKEMNSINLFLSELDQATKSNSVSAENSSKENIKMAEKTTELAAMMMKFKV